MKTKEIFIQGIKHVDLSVFNVSDDTKTYYDMNYNKSLPYSSAQQIKRCFMDNIRYNYPDDFNFASLEMRYNISGDEINQKEVLSPADNTCIDQLIGGYMRAKVKGNGKKNKKDDTETITRRSPLSISPMTPFHPEMVSLTTNEKSTMDRSEYNNDNIVFTKGNKLIDEKEMLDLLEKNNKVISKRKLYNDHRKSSGLFKFNIAIDLERLFRVEVKKHNMEIYPKQVDELKNKGWNEIKIRDRVYLELPKEYHEIYAEAIASSIANFRIKSNQSLNFDLMPTVTIAVSNNANSIAYIYRKDIDGDNKNKINIDDSIEDVETYNTPLIEEFVKNPLHYNYSGNALNDFKKSLKNKILEYYS